MSGRLSGARHERRVEARRQRAVQSALDRLTVVCRPATFAKDDIRDAARVALKQGGITRAQTNLLGVHSPP